MEEAKSSNDWWHDHELFQTHRILHPNGWNEDDLHYSFYEEEITVDEFNYRLEISTLVPRDIKQKK